MIYTITLNPAIDYHMHFIDPTSQTQTNKTNNTQMFAAGKGVNASLVLTEFGLENKSLVLTGGHTGKWFCSHLTSRGVDVINFDTGSEVRINTHIHNKNTTHYTTTTSNTNPLITQQLLSFLEDSLLPSDYVLIMGSIMEDLPHDILEQISQKCIERGSKIIFDVTGPLVKSLGKYKPFLIKPNLQELEQIFETTITTDSKMDSFASSLIDLGFKNVLVSCDSRGSFLYSDELTAPFHAKPTPTHVVDELSAGDTLVASFVAKFLSTNNLKESVEFASLSASKAVSVMGTPTSKDLPKITP